MLFARDCEFSAACRVIFGSHAHRSLVNRVAVLSYYVQSVSEPH